MSKATTKTKPAAKTSNSALNSKQKKEYAKTLYLQGDLTQKEIAVKVDVSENTLSKWCNENDREWDKMRMSLLTSKSTILRMLYDVVHKLTTEAKESEKPDAKLADQIVKYTASINNMETETSIAEIIEVSRMFINWMLGLDVNMAMNVAHHFDQFIKERLKKV